MSGWIDLNPVLTRTGRLTLMLYWAPIVLLLIGSPFSFTAWPSIPLTAAAAALWLFVYSQHNASRYTCDFWYLHAAGGYLVLFYALLPMPVSQTWPLPAMAGCSLLLWIGMRPTYLAARRAYRRVGQSGEDPRQANLIHPVGIRYHAEKAQVSFDDVIGMDVFKRRLRQAVAEILDDFHNGGRDQSRNGILLFGDPGNGKTMFAHALAGEMRLPILPVTYGDVASYWTNETTVRMQQVFNDAERQAPCVLFIDEIDSLLVPRDLTAQAEHEGPKTTNSIMTRLVDIRSRGVVVIAATNFRSRLDTAAVRDGRFDYMIEVPPPDLPARLALLEREITAAGAACDPAALAAAARHYEGFSAARVQGIARDAAAIARNAGNPPLVTADTLRLALRSRQGSLGVRMDERTPILADIMLAPGMRAVIDGIVARMTDIEATESMGGTVPGGILFFGPSGTGKTVTVKALARATGWALLAASGQDLLARPEAVEALAAQAADLRPCIIFIDEADDVLGDRRRHPETRAVADRILTAMDGARARAPDVVWVAATNHPDLIDPAALRGGRFTEKVRFDLPDALLRAAFAARWIDRCKARFAPDLTPELIATMLGEVSYANIEAALQVAVNHRVSQRDPAHPAVNRDDIAFAIMTVIDQ